MTFRFFPVDNTAVDISIAILKQLYLLRNLDDAALRQISAAGIVKDYEPGDDIYRRGETGESFYFLLSGKIELLRDQEGEQARVCGHIGPGGHFGEVALLTGKPRSISVRTLSKTRLLAFDKQAFTEVLLADPAVHLAIDNTPFIFTAISQVYFPIRGCVYLKTVQQFNTIRF